MEFFGYKQKKLNLANAGKVKLIGNIIFIHRNHWKARFRNWQESRQLLAGEEVARIEIEILL